MAGTSLSIEKLVAGGQGLARTQDKVIFVWGALPGEQVEIEITKQKKKYAEAVARKILKPSADRIEALEDHYLACSPWQILSAAAEDRWKCSIAQETYAKIGGMRSDLKLEIVSDLKAFDHYRNKMEYSFAEVLGELVFAAYERSSHTLYPQTNGCVLASAAINSCSKVILDWLKMSNVQPEQLVNLILRSNTQGQVIAALFVRESVDFKNLPQSEKLIGFQTYLVAEEHQVFRSQKLLQSVGESSLVENIHGLSLRYGIQSFFQINPPIFEQAVTDIASFVSKKDDVVDYYAGVGAIGLAISAKAQSVTLVESNDEAITFAQENASQNQLINCQIIHSPTEQALKYIESKHIVLVDPPRAGLDKSVVEKLLKTKPKRIMYLACDVATQGRDLKMLSEVYAIKFQKLYNFFPRTPHIEALCVLERNTLS